MTEDSLLHLVLASPEDLGARLVYADWLLERGDPRGEFIQLQCHERRKDRQRALLRAHEVQWLEALGLTFGQGTFERGFVERLNLNAENARTKLGELGKRAPIRALSLSGANIELRDVLLAFEHLPHLVDLHVSMLRSDLPRLAAEPVLARLTHLKLDDPDDRGAAALLQSPHLHNLRSLHIGGRDFADRGMAALVQSPSLSGLSSLVIRAWISVLHLTDSPRLSQLRSLGLPVSGIGVAGTQQLLRSPRLGPLVSFDLSDVYAGDEGVRALASCEALVHLSRLNLHQDKLTDEAALALAGSGFLRELCSLELGWNRFTARGILALLESNQLASLTHLGLGGNELGPEDIRAIASSPALSRLTRLDLRVNRLHDEGIRALAQSPHLSALQELDLRDTGLCHEGVLALIDSPHLQSLTSLHLGNDELYARQGWEPENRFGEAAAQRLRDRFGDRVVL